jgi:hypothetical protein
MCFQALVFRRLIFRDGRQPRGYGPATLVAAAHTAVGMALYLAWELWAWGRML